MAKDKFSFDFDEIRIQDTEEVGVGTAMDSWITGEEVPTEEVTTTKKIEDEILDDIPTELVATNDDIEAELDATLLSEDEEDEDVPTDGTQISKLVENYYNLGIFTGQKEEQPITTEEELYERFQNEKRNGANEYLTNFLSKRGNDYQQAFQKIFVEGISPKEYYSVTEPLQEISSLDMDLEENQVKVVRQYYKEVLGIQSDLAEKKLKIMQDAGELVTEATIAIDKIQGNVEKQLDAKAQDKAKEEANKQFANQVYDNSLRSALSSDFGNGNYQGLPVSQESISSAYANLARPAWRLPSGEEITDFQKFLLDLKKPENIKTAVLIDMLRQNNFDLSSIQVSKDNKKKSQLFDALAVKEQTIKRKNPISNSATPSKFI